MVLPTRVRQCVDEVTLHLLFLIAIVTLGPLQFGFHLVRPIISLCNSTDN